MAVIVIRLQESDILSVHFIAVVNYEPSIYSLGHRHIMLDSGIISRRSYDVTSLTMVQTCKKGVSGYPKWRGVPF